MPHCFLPTGSLAIFAAILRASMARETNPLGHRLGLVSLTDGTVPTLPFQLVPLSSSSSLAIFAAIRRASAGCTPRAVSTKLIAGMAEALIWKEITTAFKGAAIKGSMAKRQRSS